MDVNPDEGSMEKPSDKSEMGGIGEFYIARKDINGLPEPGKGQTVNIKVTGTVSEVTPDGITIQMMKMIPALPEEKDGKVNTFAQSISRRSGTQQGGV